MQENRCAIYTRKSHEEGLEQAFNSLDAQRESGQSYIQSQASLGWRCLDTTYDDGGFSGGNMKRPALKQLLTDIELGKVDTVVVYKVDRLSRSLADFSRLIEEFDKQGVSFVSVTQQFNTSNSMGRLTLNMLLSFAQFEREVTGERIRDKIAASKKKGMWMGGALPMGYRVNERKLEVIEAEATFVQRLFNDYQQGLSLMSLAQNYHNERMTTKCWMSEKGQMRGGKKLTRKYLYRLLKNPIYIGQITHGGNTYKGQHDAIISKPQFEATQALLTRDKSVTQPARTKLQHLLKGKLRHSEGYAISPSRTQKRSKSGRTYYRRYYVSQKAMKEGYQSCDIGSIPADHLESLVLSMVDSVVHQHLMEDVSTLWDHLSGSEYIEMVRELIEEVTINSGSLTLRINKKSLGNLQGKIELQVQTIRHHNTGNGQKDPKEVSRPRLLYKSVIHETDIRLELRLVIQIKQLDGRRVIVDGEGKELMVTKQNPNPLIVNALAESYQWSGQLAKDSYSTIKQFAECIGVDYERVRKRLRLRFLSPTIQSLCLTGELPNCISIKDLIRTSSLFEWDKQEAFLGLNQ